ncbi:MAG: cytidyltransferase-related domain protein [Oscillibacter sp.]|nr:cytidyltransferase-related domain protein [Oscillibacter sp.]
MERNELHLHLSQAFGEDSFLRRLDRSRTDMARLFSNVDWERMLYPLMPIEQRISCAQALVAFRPLLDAIAPQPREGWLPYTYKVASSLLFPTEDADHTPAQRDGAVSLLHFLRCLFDEERRILPFDPWLDFAFCTEKELKGSDVAEEYRQFLSCWRKEYVYELLRLGREVTPFRTLEHIAGVHHVAITVSRALRKRGGLIDLGLISGAAAAHDIGKFGCKAGERVPYLHYFYTDQWCSDHGFLSIGRIAANHSVWDLEIENLSSESLVLVYADFRVKQSRGDDGREIAQLFSLKEAFDVILSKLDNVDDTKRRRYQYVYTKLADFEEYMLSFGVDTTLATTGAAPHSRRDPALMTENEVVSALRYTAVDHNIRLMHRLGHDRLFAAILEAARTEKEPSRIRAYLSIFEEYFTYWSNAQKEQTLEFLYELLLLPDGDIRRQAAGLIGRILAGYQSGYKKELPAGTAPSPQENRPFVLWDEYLTKLIYPDRRLTPLQTRKIRYQAKTVADALLTRCTDAHFPRFAQILFRHYDDPASVDFDEAFSLLDAVLNVPLERISNADRTKLIRFAKWWLENGGDSQKAAALRLFRHIITGMTRADEEWYEIISAVENAECEGCIPLYFLQAQLIERLGLDASDHWELLNQGEPVSSVFLDNLKTATPWVLKAAGVEYLSEQVTYGLPSNVLHIATHFSNLMQVSETVVVRRLAGKALLGMAQALTPARRNEIAVEMTKTLETGQAELSQYIPEYLGQFILWLAPRELDEIIDQLFTLLTSPNTGVVNAALSTVGSMLEHYAVYSERFGEDKEVLTARWQKLAGLLLKGLASCHEAVRQEALRILGERLFGSKSLSYEDKEALFTLMAKKILFLIHEQGEQELTFFYTAAALSHIYRFIVRHRIESGDFPFREHKKVAFFPGTFDPFSLSHKGIVTEIRDLGFEVYLAVDEFSWSKKAQPSLLRRQIVSMSVADEFDVYLFPHDIPVNLANPDDLGRLRQVFSGRELYLTAGSDVVANASSYKVEPKPGSVHHLNHIIFRRAATHEQVVENVDISHITGKVIHLELPTHLEDISSSRIRENIDLGRDISNLIDPTVQDFIHTNSLYLREPQYKQLIRTGFLDFSWEQDINDDLWQQLQSSVSDRWSFLPHPDSRDTLCILWHNGGEAPKPLGYLTARILNSSGLYDALGSQALANEVRTRTAGRILLLTGLHVSTYYSDNYDVGQLLLTEFLSRAMADDCGYAVWWANDTSPEKLDLLERNGFVHINADTLRPLLYTDMRSPVVLLQNAATTLKEPFSSDKAVLQAVRNAHFRIQRSICQLYPGVTVLSLNSELIYHRLVRKITERNGVPSEPMVPRTLGEKMCVPFGKFLRGNAVPNTVTKTIHTDKVFAEDLHNFTIDAYPGYAPLESQIRTVRSFRRPAILVDDILHSGHRLNVLDPLFRKEGLNIECVMVGFLSGRGKDLMAAKGREVDSIYFVPNLRAWFIESTMYPFIGGNTVEGAESTVPGLTPSVNLILPYAYPRFYKSSNRQAVFNFSKVCLENSRDIMLAVENAYRERYARNLTLSRLSEAIILPLCPDKGDTLRYDASLSASACLENDIRMLNRTRDFLD